MKIALVVKSLGNGFFEAANKGAQEAAKNLAASRSSIPPDNDDRRRPDRGHQFADRPGVDAIAISANDPDAVVPALKKAAQRGIKVISWIRVSHRRAAFCSSTPPPMR